MSVKNLNELQPDSGYPISIAHYEIKNLLSSLLSKCKKTGYMLDNPVFNSLEEKFYSNPELLKAVDENIVPPDYLYWWPDLTHVEHFKRTVHLYLEWRHMYTKVLNENNDGTKKSKDGFFSQMLTEENKFSAYKASIFAHEKALIHFIWRFKLLLLQHEEFDAYREYFKRLIPC